MRIAIVDDLAAERTLLKDRLEWQLQRRNVQADILEYESGETFLEAARKAPFTAAFLDIYMDGMTGMEAAKKLRKTNTDCLLVFTTTSTDHALEGFQVRALHYLVKPFTARRFQQALDKFCRQRSAIATHSSVSQEELDAIRQDAEAEMDEAVKFADASPYPDPATVLDDMYVTDNERCVAR